MAVHSEAGTTDRQHLEQWLSAPYHAIGMLRPALRSTGYGHAVDAGASPWRSAATLDVIRGVDPAAARPGQPIVFPGDGSTVPLDHMSAEVPDPRAPCGFSGNVGLPLIAMFPTPPGSASSSLSA